MKTIRTSAGPFIERPFYKDQEIERICSDALAESGFLPAEPGPVRIDRFIEKRFNVPIIFEVLSAKVLGFTEFGSNGVEAIHVAEPTGERSTAAERRINSTLAHEAGHGLMHAHLFALNLDHGQLFNSDPDVTRTRVLCRDGEHPVPVAQKRKYDGRWWELQANRAIGAFLLPELLFRRFVDTFAEPAGKLGTRVLPHQRREEVIRAAAETFDVNPAAARVRLDMVFPDRPGQLTL